MANMKKLMQAFRDAPPSSIAGLPVVAVRDYGKRTRRKPDGTLEPLNAPSSNMLILDLGSPGSTTPSGNAIAVRPSGTEPKIKFYLFGHEAIPASGSLESTLKLVSDRIVAMKTDIKKLA